MPKQKKYLVLMPRIVKKAGEGYAFPLGVPYVSASMKRYGHKVITANLNHISGDDKIIDREVISLIKKYDIDVVATGGQTFQYNSILAILTIVKEFNPEILTIVGGGLITAAPIPAMKALGLADFGIIGEGEITINELCEAVEGQRSIDSVRGIIYEDELGMWKITEKRPDIENLDGLAWPDYDGFDLKYYVDNIIPTMIASNKRNSLFMLTSRSCPFQCSFCFHTTGKKYRQRSLDDVFAELDFLMEKYRPQFIFFVDELFGSNLDRLKDFCLRIKKYNIHWWSEFRVTDVTKEKLLLLKDAGCTNMSFGLESADNSVLKSMKKAITVEQIEKALKLVYEEHITIDGCFIFGDTAETYETSLRTLRWWEDHAQYDIGLGPITIYPGTYLYEYAVKNNIINDEVEFIKQGCPQVNVSKMSDEEFSDIMTKITQKNLSVRKGLDYAKVLKANYDQGIISMEGKCSVCGAINTWDDVIVFRPAPLICAKCGQRYDMPITKDMVKNIKNNLHQLLLKYKNCAIWGINDKCMRLIWSIEEFTEENIFLVDISKIKENMNVAGKRIQSPKVIDKEDIRCIVIGVPFLYATIKLQVQREYPRVEKIIDICKLFSDKFNLKGDA